MTALLLGLRRWVRLSPALISPSLLQLDTSFATLSPVIFTPASPRPLNLPQQTPAHRKRFRSPIEVWRLRSQKPAVWDGESPGRDTHDPGTRVVGRATP
jgi:hypothetical protein